MKKKRATRTNEWPKWKCTFFCCAELPRHTTRSDSSERAQEHALLIRCRCSAMVYFHGTLLPFDSSTYIRETSKRQQFRAHCSQLSTVFHFTFFDWIARCLFIPCSDTTAPIKAMQSDLLFDTSIDSGKITDWINCLCVCYRDLGGFSYDIFCAILIYSFVWCSGCMGINICKHQRCFFLVEFAKEWAKIDLDCLIVRCCVEMWVELKANRKRSEPMAISIVPLNIFSCFHELITLS